MFPSCLVCQCPFILAITKHKYKSTTNSTFLSYNIRDKIFPANNMIETDPHTNGPSGDIPIERLNLNEHHKPPPRKSPIENLPVEILHNIFEHVGPLDDWGNEPGRKYQIRNIKNCRLTCSIFNETSSRLLCQTVQVFCHPKSIQRLAEISRHDVIQKGVRRVVVCLPRYDGDFADDYNTFTLAFTRTLKLHILHGIGISGVSSPKDHERLSKAHAIWASWNRTRWGRNEATIRYAPSWDKEAYEDARPEDETHRLLIKEAHQEYKTRYEGQEALIRDGNFACSIASALAEMPRARKILFTAHPPGARSLFESLIDPSQDVSDVVYQNLLGLPGATTNLTFNFNWSFAMPDVLAAIGQGGIKPKLINVMLDFSLLDGLNITDEKTRENMSLAVEQLEEFNFHCLDKDIKSNGDLEGLNDFLTRCLDSSKLQRFAVQVLPNEKEDIQILMSDAPPVITCNLTPTLRSRVWPDLRRVHVGRTFIGLDDLQGFVRDLPRGPQKPRLILHAINLSRKSTWAAVLRTLRDETSVCVSFADVRGGELWGRVGPAVFRDEKRSKAETDDKSLAAKYVNERGTAFENPLDGGW